MVRMRALLPFLMLLGAVSALLLGATAGAAAAETTPCHETIATHHQGAPATDAPEEPATAMACCIACVSAPILTPPSRPRLSPLRAPKSVIGPRLPEGLSPAPELGPPR